MIIPKRDVDGFVEETVARCSASRLKRLMRGAMYRNVYLTGDRDGNPQTYNKTRLFIDRLASWTYSPVSLRYVMESDGDVTATDRAMGKRAIAELHKRIRRGGVDRAAREANRWARIKGKSFIKLLWTSSGFEPNVLQPEVMGVEREDLTRLDQQKAFVHTSWYTIDGFVNLVANHPPVERDKLIRKAASLAKASNVSDKPDNQMMKQVLLGGMYPYKDGSTGNQSSGQQAQVDWLGGPSPYLAPELASRMLQVDELWVWDDARDDWTVFQTLHGAGADAFITGKDRHRNIFADAYDPADSSLKGRKNPENPLSGMHPFVEFCPNELDGYFWGQSSVSSVALLQRGINRRIDGINLILRRQEQPSRAYIGFTGINQNTHAKLNKPGGWMTESSPNGKIENMQPDLPKGLWESLDKLIQYFDEVGGVTPTMGGEGDAGIRSNVHADTLLRTATAGIKDEAVEVERSIAELGNLGLQIMKTQVADKLTAWVKAGEAGIEAAAAEPGTVDEPPVKNLKPVEFSLHELPDEMYPTVDCHSSSPIFAAEEQTMLFELKKLGALSPQRLIEGLHPSNEQSLIDDLDRAEVAKAEFIQQHPEVLKHGKK